MKSTLELETIDSLRSRVASGEELQLVCFWSHKAQADGQLGPSCLSHWWPSPIEVDGLEYPTGEHYLMAKKAALFGDEATAAAILESPSPVIAKQLGREVRGYVEAQWAAVRAEVAFAGNMAKFGQHEHMAEFLLSTGSSVLVEASPVDTIWGIGRAADDEGASDPNAWRGSNLLGFVLMEVRRRLACARRL